LDKKSAVLKIFSKKNEKMKNKSLNYVIPVGFSIILKTLISE